MTQQPHSLRPAVAVLGTGAMGAPIARNLLARRIRGAGLEPHPGQGAGAGREAGPRSPPSAGERRGGRGVLITMLTDGAAVVEPMMAARWPSQLAGRRVGMDPDGHGRGRVDRATREHRAADTAWSSSTRPSRAATARPRTGSW